MTRTLPLIASFLTLAGALDARAQTAAWPTKPIRLVLGFAAGGNSDMSARLFAAEMGKRLGQQVVVDNRPGASGVVAATAVAKGNSDGHTLLWATGAMPATGALQPTLPYDTLKSFTYVSTTVEFPFVIAVRPDSPYRNIADLIAAGKAGGAKIGYATTGVGSTPHLTIEYLQHLTGARLVHIPYKNGTQAMLAVATGEAQMAISSPLEILAQGRAGKVRAIAVTGKSRFPKAPELPTVEEAGVKGFDVTTWNGLAATAGTPPDVVKRLAAEIYHAAKQEDLRQTVDRLGSEVVTSTPAELQKRVEVELKRWTAIVRAKQIKPE